VTCWTTMTAAMPWAACHSMVRRYRHAATSPSVLAGHVIPLPSVTALQRDLQQKTTSLPTRRSNQWFLCSYVLPYSSLAAV
jgi:hypothetical protein